MSSGCLEHKESIQRALRALRKYLEHSESNQRGRDQSDFVIPSEPKILRLVSSETKTEFTNSVSWRGKY